MITPPLPEEIEIYSGGDCELTGVEVHCRRCNTTEGPMLTHEAEEWVEAHRCCVDCREIPDECECEPSAADSERPRIVCLSGSMRFEDDMRRRAAELSLNGAIVVMPHVNGKTTKLLDGEKGRLDAVHLAKIDLADRVEVITRDGYIGDSTRAEIEYAKRAGTPVRFIHFPLPSSATLDVFEPSGPATVPEPVVRPTEYEVSCLPEGGETVFDITVKYRGNGLWAVTRHMRCLRRDGRWDYEPIPSERTDEWKEQYRYDLDTALALAREAAPLVRVNGRTAADAVAEAGREAAAGMRDPVRCTRCSHVYDLATVEVMAGGAGRPMWRCPGCRALMDDRGETGRKSTQDYYRIRGDRQ